MVSNMQILLIVGLIAGLTTTVFGTTCYVCHSDGSDKSSCGEHFQADGVRYVDCSKTLMPRFLQNALGMRNATGCMKVTTDINNSKIISRACFYGDVKDTSRGCITDPSNILGRQIACDVCTGDYCNSSTAITSMSIIAFISIYLLRHFCF